MRASIVICQVRDMDRAVGFYRDVLGFKPGNVSPYWSDFDAGGVELGLHPPFEGRKSDDTPACSGWILGLQVEDLKALRAKLENAGARITGDYHDIPGGVVFEFVDPDGNPVQAVQCGASASDMKPE